MAFIQVNFSSISLRRTVPICVVLPADKNNGRALMNDPDKKYKTIYLLHGLFGDYGDWERNTRIQAFATEKNLAVVMPDGDNSFYIDQPGLNRNYGQFIGEELVEVTRRLFPLSRKREDTFIGGLSMGGFGALRNGFKYSETFGAIVSLSAAIHMFELEPGDTARNMVIGEDWVLGDWDEAVKTDKNPAVCLQIAKEKQDKGICPMPKLFMTVGTEDGLIYANRSFKAKCEEAGVDIYYYEAPGMHNWDYWDTHIQKALEWLPLDASEAEHSSGNTVIKD